MEFNIDNLDYIIKIEHPFFYIHNHSKTVFQLFKHYKLKYCFKMVLKSLRLWLKHSWDDDILDLYSEKGYRFLGIDFIIRFWKKR